MYNITQITDDYAQTQNVILQDGTSFKLTIVYKPIQQGWFIQDLVYGTFRLQNMRITSSPNMLLQFINQIPFGLACFTALGREPTQLQDFSSGNFTLFVLSEEEVVEYKVYLSG